MVKEVKKSGKKKWEDPEFGPKPDDEHGSFSIYHKGSPIPGYPDPNDITWIDLDTIVPEGSKPKFLSNGAQSGDVI